MKTFNITYEQNGNSFVKGIHVEASSFGDYYRLKSNKGNVLEKGWLKDGIIYGREVEGSSKVDEDDSWLHEDEYYDKEGKLRNLKDLL